MTLTFSKKAIFFNDYFSNQCLLSHTSRTLSSLNLKTYSGLQSIDSSGETISAIILRLNSKKAHDHDGISINMLKISAPFARFENWLMFSLFTKKATEKLNTIVSQYPYFGVWKTPGKDCLR